MAKEKKQKKEKAAKEPKQASTQQFGMKMPGGRRSRSGGPDVYTGLLFLSVLVLATATTLMYFAAVEVSPAGLSTTSQPEMSRPLRLRAMDPLAAFVRQGA